MSQSGFGAITAMGPISPVNGFPEWFMDSNGTAVGLMPYQTYDQNGNPQVVPFSIAEPPDPDNPFSMQIGFGAEAFWWSLGARIEVGEAEFRLTIAQEAAFFGAEEPSYDNQFAFGRIRVDIRDARPGDYEITLPWGNTIVMNVPAGDDRARYVNDNGDAFPYMNRVPVRGPDGEILLDEKGRIIERQRVINLNVQSFLKTTSAPSGHLGNPDANAPLELDENGNPRLFKVKYLGQNGLPPGPGQALEAQTNLFQVSGKLVDVDLETAANGDLVVANGLVATVLQAESRHVLLTGGRLQVRDIIGDLTITGGSLAPGNSPGLTLVTGDMIVGGGAGESEVEIEIEGIDYIGPGGHDLLRVMGNVDLNGLNLRLLISETTSIEELDGVPIGFLEYAGTLTGSFGNELEGLVEADTPWGRYGFLIDYGDRNGGVITATMVVPEPATLTALGLAGVALLRRRRRV